MADGNCYYKGETLKPTGGSKPNDSPESIYMGKELFFTICFNFSYFSAYKTGMNRRTDLYLKENEHIRK